MPGFRSFRLEVSIMANVIDEVIREGRTIRLYDNGMERDAATGHIIKPANGTLITSENAADYHRARRERKKMIVAQAANESVNRQELIERYGEDAFIAAVVSSVMVKAQNPKDPKQVEAARFIFGEAGVGVDAGDESNDRMQEPRVLLLLAELHKRNDSEKVIEGQYTNVEE